MASRAGCRVERRKGDRRRPDELLDRGMVVLPSEVEVAEQGVRPLIVREEPDQLLVVRQHLLDVAFHRRIEAEHHVLLAFAHPPGQRHGTGDRVDEFPGRAGGVGQAEMSQREIGVLCDRQLVELPSVGRPQLLGQFPAFQIQFARFGGGGGDGNLSVAAARASTGDVGAASAKDTVQMIAGRVSLRLCIFGPPCHVSERREA